MGLVDDAGRFDSVQFRHPNVQDHGIGIHALYHFNQSSTSGRGAYYFEIRFQQSAQTFGH